MACDFHKLKTVSVANGEVTLRVPERWGVWPDEDRPGYWGCYEKDADGNEPDTGTLWIQVDHIWMGGDGPLPPEATDMQRTAEEMSKETPPGGGPLLESVLLPAEHGCRWRYVYDVEEEGEPLRFWHSHFFLSRGPHMAIIAMTLVLSHAQMDDPEFVELREIMEREIAAAFFDPFRLDERGEAEEVLGELHLCNFDDRVKIPLPEVMSVDVDEDSDTAVPRWYARLETDSSHAGMFVECQILEATDDDGNQILTPPEMYREVLEGVVGKGPGGDCYLPMPGGAVAYGAYEDKEGLGEVDEDGRPFCGLSNHVWRYMSFEYGQARLLMVELMLPLPEHDRQPYPALVSYMHRAVRRAEFPGFTPPERY